MFPSVVIMIVSYVHTSIFNFWGFGTVYDMSRDFDGEIKTPQESLLSLDNGLQNGYLTT